MQSKPYSELRDELSRIMPKRFFILYTVNNTPRVFVGTSESITGRHGYIVICEKNSYVIERCHKFHDQLINYIEEVGNDITQSISEVIDYIAINKVEEVIYPKQIEYS